jgi:flagellin
MVMNVNTNAMSLNTQRSLSKTNQGLATALARLSSGLRINSAKDDAAGLAIASRMEAQVRGISQGIRNANDGISLAQVAEGALGGMGEALQRMRELAVQSVNSSNSAADRTSLQLEYAALDSEIDAIATRTQFNGVAIIGAGAGANLFQVGPNAGNTISLLTTDYSTAISPGGTIASSGGAATAIAAVDTALTTLNSARSTLGAVQSRIETSIRSLDATRENTAAARGRIMDADFAAETAALTRFQILQQAGIAMLAQANNSPQAVLALLQ